MSSSVTKMDKTIANLARSSTTWLLETSVGSQTQLLLQQCYAAIYRLVPYKWPAIVISAILCTPAFLAVLAILAAAIFIVGTICVSVAMATVMVAKFLFYSTFTSLAA